MPNYPIPTFIRSHIGNRINELASRTLQYALADFPLTTAQIQYSIMPAERVGTMRRLIAEGVKTIEKHTELRLAFLRSENLPALRRSIVLHISLSEWVVVERSTQYSIPRTKFDITEGHYLVPDLSGLDDEQRAELVQWLQKALRQHRFLEIASNCVQDLVMNAATTPTASHLHALWPAATRMLDIPGGWVKSQREPYEKWQQRFRNPTRSFKRYQPTEKTRNNYEKLIIAADMAATAGLVLPPYRHPKDAVRCDIEHWERLDNDLKFPLA